MGNGQWGRFCLTVNGDGSVCNFSFSYINWFYWVVCFYDVFLNLILHSFLRFFLLSTNHGGCPCGYVKPFLPMVSFIIPWLLPSFIQLLSHLAPWSSGYWSQLHWTGISKARPYTEFFIFYRWLPQPWRQEWFGDTCLIPHRGSLTPCFHTSIFKDPPG